MNGAVSSDATEEMRIEERITRPGRSDFMLYGKHV